MEALRSRCRRGTLPCQQLPAGGWVVSLVDRDQRARPADQRSDRPARGGDQPTGHADQRDLAPLAQVIRDLTRQHQELAVAAALWQARATQLEERLAQLTAGQQDAHQNAHAARGEENQPATRQSLSHALGRWWRRVVASGRRGGG